MKKMLIFCISGFIFAAGPDIGLAESGSLPGIDYSKQRQSVGQNAAPPGSLKNNNEDTDFSECGTVVTPEQAEHELSLRDKGGYGTLPERDGDYYVPISFHIVRRSDGSGGYPPHRLHLSLRDLNMQFQQAGIQFFRLRDGADYAVHFIDDDNYYYNTDNSTMYNALRQESPVANTINVYFLPNFPYGGLSTFTSHSVQGILMNNSYSGLPDNLSTLAHEVGHYFDLYHTHDTYYGYECPDGSNCLQAGDLLCDTPADPNLSGKVDENCNYTGTDTLPTGCSGTYDPQTENLMSYSYHLCQEYFSPFQIDKMIATLINERPELLDYDYTDSDGDGIIDLADNCLDSYNPDQTDADFDFIGDDCDICPDDILNDADGDGLCADNDNCPSIANPDQFDIDASGIGDICGCVDGTYRFTGDSGDVMGWRARGAGDVNNDGYDDIISGAVYSSIVDNMAGRVYVYSGYDGSILFDFRGEVAVDIFGIAVNGAGDVNNDGIDDMIVGAYLNDAGGNYSGRAYVFYGDEVGPFPVVRNAADADKIFTGESSNDFFGISVSDIGDVDADGYDDILIGASWAGGGSEGMVYVYSGQTDALLYSVTGEASNDAFGYSVRGAGLVNGDTIPDFIVGARNNGSGGAYAGKAYVYSGEDGSLIHTFIGEYAGDYLGGMVSGAGDVNNDGFADLVVGAPFGDMGGINSGQAYVFSGDDGSVLHTFTGLESNDLLGWAVSGAGDVNLDGYADVVVGAPRSDYSSDMSGAAYVFSGFDGSILFETSGEHALDWYARDVSGTADLNADGVNDLIVGAFNYGAITTTYTGRGRVYAYLMGDNDADGFHTGCDNCPPEYNPGQNDMNGNGIGDICEFLCGDANNDGTVNILDITFLISFLYKEGSAPESDWASDPNGDGIVNILDITYLISYLYKSGSPPVCP